MIRAVHGMEAAADDRIRDAMFQARRRLFKERLGWDVRIDERGWEIDEYDHEKALYLVSVDENDAHCGSLRLLPTDGPTMLRDHFAHLFDGIRIESPRIWECTRFCVEADAANDLTPTGVQRVTTELLLGICETALDAGATHILGVFDPRMIRIYRRGGWSPHLMGESGSGRDAIYLGLWDVTPENADAIRRAGGFEGSVLEAIGSAARRRTRAGAA